MNDYGFWHTLTHDPLVYATDENGNFKMDEFGNYYTEVAGSGENLNKQVVSAFDTITKDGST